jgi:glycosyltransferase involved in cell wall biosynthesis
MKPIVAVSELRPGASLAHAINVIKTAGGFARLGRSVTVLCREPLDGLNRADAAAAYAEPALRWAFAPPSTHGSPERFASWAAAEAAALEPELVYARHFQAAVACADAGLATALETHAHVGDSNPALLTALGATARQELPISALVTISRRLAAYYVSRGAGAARIAVIPDGVDTDLFTRPADPGPPPFARDPGDPIVLYAGHLYDYKGIPTLLDAAALRPAIRFHLLGGAPDDVERVRSQAAQRALRNVAVHGPRPHAAVPRWLWHADALLLPPSGRHPSAAWTSPVKLGEYLAAGPPVIASRIPGLLDWVDEPTVRWFAPDDPASLTRALDKALSEGGEPERRGAARAIAERFSYRERALAILRIAGTPDQTKAGGPAP